MKSSELVQKVIKAGWIEIRQTGSHKIFKHPATGKQVTVPFHGTKEIGKGLAAKILKIVSSKSER